MKVSKIHMVRMISRGIRRTEHYVLQNVPQDSVEADSATTAVFIRLLNFVQEMSVLQLSSCRRTFGPKAQDSQASASCGSQPLSRCYVTAMYSLEVFYASLLLHCADRT